MFGGDPFADPFGHMRRQMTEMDRMMNEPFGIMGHMNQMMSQMLGSAFGRQPMLGFDPMQQQAQHSHRQRDPMAMDLFDGFGFGGLGGGLMRAMENSSNNPNSVVFSQSTMVMTNPDGTQRVVSNSTRKAGDVKETRHAVRDGVDECVSVGHHIGNRTHVIEKKRDKDGRFRQSQKFVNLDQDEAEKFNEEFKSRATRNISGLFGGHHEPERRAIEDGSRGSRSRNRVAEARHPGSSSSNPIVTVPDDDDDEEEQNPRSKNLYNPYLRTGPTIREVSDEEAEATERNKRRRGPFGKFFGGSNN